jgi:hypothetical protein
MSNQTQPLMPVDQKTVDFYGDEITAALIEVNGQQKVCIPLKPICDFLGVNWDAQRQRINRDPVLSEVIQGAVVITAPSPTGRGGGPQEMLCLPLEYLNGWLFGINAKRVKEEIQERLIRYQKECYSVLAAAFLPTVSAPAENATIHTLTQIREMGLAIAHIAEQQMEIERRVTSTADRLDRGLQRAAVIFDHLGQRITAVERHIKAGKLTEEQAVEIKKRVNQIAYLLTEQDPGRSHFQAVYAALQEETGATSYKSIPPAAFEAAVAWLDNWIAACQRANATDR